MHQIFYIDIDEEITSVIDRLKKSKTTENFFVVSPRSLILQSVVSLKLLKREAEKERKQIAIVVNDQAAGTKVEKAGILVLTSLKGLENGEEIKEDFGSKMEIKSTKPLKQKNSMDTEKSSKKTRLQKIGSDTFYSTEPPKEEAVLPSGSALGQEPKLAPAPFSAPPEAPLSASPFAENRNTSDIRKERTSFSYTPEKNFDELELRKENHGAPAAPTGYVPNRIGSMEAMDPYKEKVVEGFFNPGAKMGGSPNLSKPLGGDVHKNLPVSHKMRKVIFAFAATCVVLASFVAGYLFLPKATIVATLRSETKKFDLEVQGSFATQGVVSKELAMPARLIEKEDTYTGSFKATGKKASSSDTSQKAKGKLTIYNEYNTESQQLVATTRFLSSEGKLFRLVKGVNVPGMSGGKPGSVEAEVIADQSGEDYNIKASDFKIPGFEGSPKYEKFYAKSSAAMSGGGSGSSSGPVVISQADLDAAKKQSEEKLKEKLETSIKDEIGSGSILLSDASEKTISETTTTSRVNEVATEFEYTAKGKIKALVFSESDVKKIAAEVYAEANKDKPSINAGSIKIMYGASSPDFNAKKISVKATAEVPINTTVNWEEFKQKVLGKNDDEIKELLKEYPQIEKININYWPTFMSQKIPQYEKRVSVEVKNGSE